MNTSVIRILTELLVILPTSTFVLIGVLSWFRIAIPERLLTSLVGATFGAVTLTGVIIASIRQIQNISEFVTPVGTWFSAGHHDVSVTLLFDHLSAPMVIFGAALTGLVAAFARRYLHREPGFVRFYLLLTLLGTGFQIVVLAGSLALLLVGWELVGLSSALLIAFFHNRTRPVRHGLRAFITYRVCDVALLMGTIWIHHIANSTDFRSVGGETFGVPVPEDSIAIIATGLLFILATTGKSGQLPWTGWLPRAMEGPTPSSAIFYGALSIHLGPYLLLRCHPLWEASPFLSAVIVTIGALTALHSTFVGRVQTDIKSVLAYASATQVGMIFIEIGLGLYGFAMVHIIGHASMRSLQILRSPNLLHDIRHLESNLGTHLPPHGVHLERLVPAKLQPWLYMHALERGFVDAWARRFILSPLASLIDWVSDLERGWIDWVGNDKQNYPTADSFKDEGTKIIHSTESRAQL